MLVVDASAVTELLLGRPAATTIDDAFEAHGTDLHAPHLLDVEVLSALRSLTLRGELGETRAQIALQDLADLPIERYPHDVLLPRAWQLRETISAYDAAYVALAEALAPDGAVLLTTDGRLARAAARFTAVELADG